jgi:diguanylate cyclase (GGDEF)-like protein
VDPVAAVAGVAAAVAVVVAIAAVKQSVRARRAEGVVGRLQRELVTERHAASHDHLTGLPNRRSFYCLGAALVREAARRPLVAILVDLDDFKRINDTFGHPAGDEVLVNVARRLVGFAGGGLVARLGGDEFAALLHEPPAYGDRSPANGDQLAKTAGRITEVLSAPVLVTGGWKIAVRASIGCVAVPGGADLDEVLERADAAMYRAKTALMHREPVQRTGARRLPDPGGWFSAGEQRRQVRAVAGDSVTWS